MQQFPMNPLSMFSSVWKNRQLILTFIHREIAGRYRGSIIGIFWSFFYPIFMLMVYTFVFSVVFKARWNATSDSKTEFALILFAGLIVFNLFAECVNRAPSLILANANYVKKVIFPLEILAIVSLGNAFFHFSVSFIVWLIFYLILFGLPPLTILFFPFTLIPLALLTLGLSWGLSSLGVFLRDVSQVIGIGTTALLFLSPIFYSTTSLPQQYQILLHLNPLTPIIEYSRNALLFNKLPDMGLFSLYFLFTLLTACLGFAWFQKTRKGFADVI